MRDYKAADEAVTAEEVLQRKLRAARLWVSLYSEDACEAIEDALDAAEAERVKRDGERKQHDRALAEGRRAVARHAKQALLGEQIE